MNESPEARLPVLESNRLESAFMDKEPLYPEAAARREATRCLYCYDAPCVRACPVRIDIPGFIRKLASGNIRGAAGTILRSNLLGVTTARVCPVEELCVGACVYNALQVRPVSIGRLQRYATTTALQQERASGRKMFVPQPSSGKKVALIGAGPASLSCAATLALEGVRGVIFERSGLPGGLNTTGIAPYKLHAEAALEEIDWLLESGFELRYGVEVGRDLTAARLRREFDAVFLGAGLGKDQTLGIPGEDGDGVWGATELIRRIKLTPNFSLPASLRKVAVIGGGNTAIDCAHELALLGVREVDILYRRTEREMPGYAHELTTARLHGVRLREHIRPLEIRRDGGLVLRACRVDSGRELEFPVDAIVVAIGQEKRAAEIVPGIAVDDRGRVVVDPVTRRTSLPDVYAGGDCVNGGKEVVNAVADGREATLAMLASWGIPAQLFHRQER